MKNKYRIEYRLYVLIDTNPSELLENYLYGFAYILAASEELAKSKFKWSFQEGILLEIDSITQIKS